MTFTIPIRLVPFLVLVAVIPVEAQVTVQSAVTLLGAGTANNALTVPVRPGDQSVQLHLHVTKPLTGADEEALTAPLGQLVATPFQATSVGAVAAVTLTPSSVSLAPNTVKQVTLQARGLRPGAQYKGAVVLTTGSGSHTWEITLSTAGREILKVVPVGVLQYRARTPWGTTGDFVVTLRNEANLGPYSNLRAYFEPTGAPAAKAIAPILLTDAFSFFSDAKRQHRLDLKSEASGTSVDRDRLVHVRVKGLNAGEYNGKLTFATDDTNNDAPEASLAMKIQVRHHWFWPALVIGIGSLLGWFGTKYVGALRDSQQRRRELNGMRARADQLARADVPGSAWAFSSEAGSQALTSIRVVISQLSRLSESPMRVMSRKNELDQLKTEVGKRLENLERFRDARLRVQPRADQRPAAQSAIGGILRQAVTLLERSALDVTQAAEFNSLLGKAQAWVDAATFLEQYRTALVARRGSEKLPGAVAIAQLPEGPVKIQLIALLEKCPDEAKIKEANLEALGQFDRDMASLVLLWRNREQDWAKDLAKASADGDDIARQFELVDQRFWDLLKKTKGFGIAPDATRETHPKAFDLVEVRLTLPAGIEEGQMLRHPLRVNWTVQPPDHNARGIETDGLRLVQYFHTPGKVAISAMLRYNGEQIPAAGAGLTLDPPMTIERNPEYQKRRFFIQFADWAPLLFAILFAATTGLSAAYDATFGSAAQYLALFVWAAGAATGGNMFKQLGESGSGGSSANVL